MNKIQLPPYVEFHEDIQLLVYRPIGSMNEASVDKVVEIIGDLEAKVQEPFNRFLASRNEGREVTDEIRTLR
jgi:hypothetical protein